MWFWRKKQPLFKDYVSELDRFLQEFDKKPEASSISRRAEEAKYEQIDLQRDRTDIKTPAVVQLWDGNNKA